MSESRKDLEAWYENELGKIPAGLGYGDRVIKSVWQASRADLIATLESSDVLWSATKAIWVENGGVEVVFESIDTDGNRDGQVQKARCIGQAKAAIKAIVELIK